MLAGCAGSQASPRPTGSEEVKVLAVCSWELCLSESVGLGWHNARRCVDEGSEACPKACSCPVVKPGVGPKRLMAGLWPNFLLQGMVPQVGESPVRNHLESLMPQALTLTWTLALGSGCLDGVSQPSPKSRT